MTKIIIASLIVASLSLFSTGGEGLRLARRSLGEETKEDYRDDDAFSLPPLPNDVDFQLPQIGNGYTAQFVNQTGLFYVGGIFNGRKTNSTRAGLPAFGRWLPVCLQSEWAARPGHYPFKLDQETATVSLRGSCVYPISGELLQLEFNLQWYHHRKYKHIQVYDFEVTGKQYSAGPPITVDFEIEMMNFDLPADDPVILQELQLLHADTVAINYQTLVSEEESSSTQFVSLARDHFPNGSYSLSVKAGQTVKRTFVQAVATSLDDPNSTVPLVAQAVAEFTNAKQAAQEPGFRQSHVDLWEDLWSKSIKTDAATSLYAINSSYYGILVSVRADWPYSTSPGGLSTDGYNGHSFWDEDTWVMPNLMLFHPDIAHGSGLKYRFNRLAGAMVNARTTLGQKNGAAFPWESAFTGENVCPAPLFAHTEIHITADVALSIRDFWRMTSDKKFLAEAWPVLNETSQFWIDRTTVLEQMKTQLISTSAIKNNLSINLNNVTGPDEYHLGNNSCYTNYAVQSAVAFYLEASKILNMPVTREAAATLIAQNMTIPYNATANYHPEYDGYKGQLVKQADVILLNYPLQYSMSTSTTKNDLNYYSKRTLPNKSGASTMTWSMFSVGYLSIKNQSAGDHFYYEGFVNNCFPPYGQWYQALEHQGNDNFITGGGGFLQNVWAGYGAMRISSHDDRSSSSSRSSGAAGSSRPSNNSLRIHIDQISMMPNASYFTLQGVNFSNYLFDFTYTYGGPGVIAGKTSVVRPVSSADFDAAQTCIKISLVDTAPLPNGVSEIALCSQNSSSYNSPSCLSISAGTDTTTPRAPSSSSSSSSSSSRREFNYCRGQEVDLVELVAVATKN